MHLRADVASMHWPRVVGAQAARLLATLSQLDVSESWPTEMLQIQQTRQINLILQHAWATVPFYQRHHRELIGTTGKQEITADQWSSIPLMARTHIQSANKDLWSQALPPSHGNTWTDSTSGSTGGAITHVHTALAQHLWNAITLREVRWHERDVSKKLVAIRAGIKNQEQDDWGAPFSLLYETGPAASLHTKTPLAEQLDWLARQQPQYLITYPSLLRELIKLSEEKGVRLDKLEQVQTFAETLYPADRELCESAWGVPIADMYSCQEAGYIALQCPERDHYHIQSEVIHVEVLDDDDQPCQPGEIGRVVLTTLHNFGMPLIRYALGDYAEVGEPCDCGRNLPVLKRIMGRERNMLRYPNGDRRWPSPHLRKLGYGSVIKQYQYVQHSLEEIELKLALTRPLEADEEDALRARIIKGMEYPFKLRFTYLDEIPKGPNGKFEDFRCEIVDK